MVNILGEENFSHNTKQRENLEEKLHLSIGVTVFEMFNQLKDEIKENFPYRVIHVDTAEADDIIAY